MDYQYTVEGGVAPVTFSIIAGALPTGLTMDSNGLVTGNRTVPGFYTWTVYAVDAAGESCSFEDSAYVLGLSGDPLDGIVGVPYATAFIGLYGILPYVYTVTAGALPTGLTLSAGGIVSGTPTVAGNYNFTIQVEDGQNIVYDQTYSVTIVAAASAPISLTDIDADAYANSITTAHASLTCTFYRGGTFVVKSLESGMPNIQQTGNWHNAPAVDVGDDYEIRIVGVRTTISGVGATVVLPIDTGWGALSTGQIISVQATANNVMLPNETQEFVGTYTIREIASPVPEYTASMRLRAEATL